MWESEFYFHPWRWKNRSVCASHRWGRQKSSRTCAMLALAMTLYSLVRFQRKRSPCSEALAKRLAPNQPHLPLLPVRWLEITRALAKGWYLLVDNAVGVRLLFHPCVKRHYQSDFWRSCAPPKSCQNQNSFGDPSKHLPNTTETGWVFLILKKHVLVGQPNEQASLTLSLFFLPLSFHYFS